MRIDNTLKKIYKISNFLKITLCYLFNFTIKSHYYIDIDIKIVE